MNKLIVAGDSMGGATALAAGDEDARIKAVLTHDPWSHIVEPRIAGFTNLLSKPLQMTNTTQFVVQELYQDPFGAKFAARMTKKEQYENLTIDKTDHLYQNDATIISPFELELVIYLAYTKKGMKNLKNDSLVPS